MRLMRSDDASGMFVCFAVLCCWRRRGKGKGGESSSEREIEHDSAVMKGTSCLQCLDLNISYVQALQVVKMTCEIILTSVIIPRFSTHDDSVSSEGEQGHG